jgi:hypothetical protein
MKAEKNGLAREHRLQMYGLGKSNLLRSRFIWIGMRRCPGYRGQTVIGVKSQLGSESHEESIAW